MGSIYLEWTEYNPVWPYLERVRDNCGAKSREVVLSSCGIFEIPNYRERRFSGLGIGDGTGESGGLV